MSKLVAPIDNLFKELLPSFVYEPEWASTSERDRLTYTWCDASAKLALRCMIRSMVRELGISLHRFDARPSRCEDPFEHDRDWIRIDDVAYKDHDDLSRQLRVIFENLARQRAWMNEPGFAERFDRDFEGGAEALRWIDAGFPLATARAFIGLAPDVDVVAELLPWLRLRMRRVPERPMRRFVVPEHFRVCIEDATSVAPSGLPRKETIRLQRTAARVGKREFEQRYEAHSASVRAALSADREVTLFTIASPDIHFARVHGSLVLAPGPRLLPSKDLVISMHARFARTEKFADFIAKLGESEWRAVYEGTQASDVDPIAACIAEVERSPKDLSAYMRLAKLLADAGRAPEGDVWLALGYLRTKNALSIAESKLAAAKAKNPKTPGLAAAAAELAAARR